MGLVLLVKCVAERRAHLWSCTLPGVETRLGGEARHASRMVRDTLRRGRRTRQGCSRVSHQPRVLSSLPTRSRVLRKHMVWYRCRALFSLRSTKFLTHRPHSQDPQTAAQIQQNGRMPTQQDITQAQEKQKQEEEMRADMLARLIDPQAKERLNRISLVKPDKVISTQSLTQPPQPRPHPCRRPRNPLPPSKNKIFSHTMQ